MYYFKKFLQELSEETKVKFNVIDGSGSFMIKGLDKSDGHDTYSFININLDGRIGKIQVEKSFEICLPLLKSYVEEKYRELFSFREKFFSDVFEGNEIPMEECRRNLPMLESGCEIFMVSIGEGKYETINLLKNIYKDSDIIVMIYDSSIILLETAKDKKNEAEKIINAVTKKFRSGCCVSYGLTAHSIEELKKSYYEAKAAMELGKRLKGRNRVYNYEDMFFERAVYSINSDVKKEIYDKFKDKFNSFDDDMINTIEEFIRCNLNISEVAKNLYIHRNTLIYRLEKIEKDTGYDIRNFRDAATFTMAFLIWKELR